MKEFILLLLFCHVASPALHSLKYSYIASSQVPNFPEFVTVGLIDGVQMYHYDSNTQRAEPRQDWMNKVTDDDPQYWQTQTQVSMWQQRLFRIDIETLKNRFDQTGGVHVYQRMYGCEWDDETGDVTGYDQHGYDGEDFISFDLKTKTWIAPTPQAVITKHEWDRDTAGNERLNNYLTQICIEWLKKYVGYGRSSLQRTVRPSVSLLQKSPSSPVTCHATGFHPDKVMLFWMRDGELHHEGVDHGETLQNHDGTFQRSVDLDVSSIKPEDWGKYKCVFQLYGVEDINTKLDPAVIKTNMEKPSDMTIPIIAAVVVIALIGIAAIGFAVYKKRQAKCPPSSENSSELSQESLLHKPDRHTDLLPQLVENLCTGK